MILHSTGCHPALRAGSNGALFRRACHIATTPRAPLLGSVFPWSLPYIVLACQATMHLREIAMLVGLLGGLLIAIVGCWEFVRRDVA